MTTDGDRPNYDPMTDDYAYAHAQVKALRLSDARLWELACDRGVDFWIRQGAYIELEDRGYTMPRYLPIAGDSMPPKKPPRLCLVHSRPTEETAP